MRSRDVLIYFIFIVLFTACSVSNSYAGEILEDLGATFVTHFDREINVDKPEQLNFKRHGGRIISNGIRGGCLKLNVGEYLTVNSSEILDSSEGTISLWVRPHWIHDATQSHTFLSFLWNDEKGSYGALSAGWWGAHSTTYFILNNHYPHASGNRNQIRFSKDKWTHLLCAWKAGEKGYVKLYINGCLVSQREGFAEETIKLKGPIFIGGDIGTNLSKNRWADCDIDELALFPRALPVEEILEIYIAQGLMPYSPKVNSEGTILESRVIFDEGREWMTAAGAVETIDRIKKAGFNVYIPCVWHGQGTRYTSQVAPTENDQVFNEDPLTRVINLAHLNGIEVHPWFCVALRQRHFLNDFYDENTPEQAFDLHRPGFRNFIVTLISDVVARYDVDGINLDYIRTMGLCTCSFCIDGYRKKYGRNLLDDMYNKTPNGGVETHIQDWQDSAVESVVKDIAEKSKARKPGLIISIDGYPLPRVMTTNSQGRQELLWAKKGFIDAIYVMDYRESPNFEMMQSIKDEMLKETYLIPLLGNYAKNSGKSIIPRDENLLALLIKYVQCRWVNKDIGIYLYGILTDSQISTLHASVFSKKAIPSWNSR